MLVRRFLTSPWFAYLALLASAPLLGAAIAAANPVEEGVCSGIGWGCSLFGWDLAGFTLLIYGVPYATGLAVVLGLLSFLPPRFRVVTTTLAWIGYMVPWGFVLAWNSR